MDKNGYTSVYVSKKLKRQLVEMAQAQGYEIRRGRGSRLAQFIEGMVRASTCTSEGDVAAYPLYTLVPELRSVVVKLSRMSDGQQKRACAMLALLFDGGESAQDSPE